MAHLKYQRVLQIGLLVLLTAAVFTEVYVHAFLIQGADKATAANMYLIAGLLVGILPLCISRIRFPASRMVPYVQWIIIAVLLWILFNGLTELLPAHPLDHKIADMLPIMEVMSYRFLTGQPVYAKIMEIWEGMQPIYLPAMWMPFCISSLFDLDPRWITASWIAMGIIIIGEVWNLRTKSWFGLIVFVPVYWMIASITAVDVSLLMNTQEGIVIGYYMFLAYALWRDNPYLVGVASALCLMSRFSLLFWLIAFGLYLLFTKDYKYFLRAGLTCVVIVLGAMVVTGAIRHLDVFFNLQRVYLNAVRPNNEWKYGGLLQDGLGMARYWGYAHLRDLHRLFLLINVLVPVLLFGAFMLFQTKLPRKVIALCILKICLVLFFNFLLIPVPYLFYTSTFFSLIILISFLNNDPERKNMIRSLESTTEAAV